MQRANPLALTADAAHGALDHSSEGGCTAMFSRSEACTRVLSKAEPSRKAGRFTRRFNAMV